MFARWQKRETEWWDPAEQTWFVDVCWRAVVVQSVRESGRVVQRHVAYLGSIRDLEDSHARLIFWWKVLPKLDKLGAQLTPEMREKIMAQLVKKVGEPPPEEELARLRRLWL